jgi:methionyl-tRNA formyltransferase
MNSGLYIVAGQKPWNKVVFNELISKYEGDWRLISDSSDLCAENLKSLSPSILFFLHWSDKISNSIINTYECINFHMTDVPYGRGGSPLQNLLSRGKRETRLSALRMTAEFDAGPVYLKRSLSLEGSTAEEIYLRASFLAAEMMREIVEKKIQPVDQSGEPTIFKRRKPLQSEIPDFDSLGVLHDFIRMLDADGYPKAYFERGGFRYEFAQSSLYSDCIKATVNIVPIKNKVNAS